MAHLVFLHIPWALGEGVHFSAILPQSYCDFLLTGEFLLTD